MIKTHALTLASTLALVAFGVVSLPACASDIDDQADDRTAEESSSADAVTTASGINRCKPRSSYIAHWNRLCPGRAVCAYDTTYRDDGKVKQCPGGGASSATCHCRPD